MSSQIIPNLKQILLQLGVGWNLKGLVPSRRCLRGVIKSAKLKVVEKGGEELSQGEGRSGRIKLAAKDGSENGMERLQSRVLLAVSTSAPDHATSSLPYSKIPIHGRVA